MSGIYGPQLEIEVEKRIAAEEKPGAEVYDVATLVAVASFLVSLAQFAYDIYKDQRDRHAVDPDAIRRESRIHVAAPPQLDQERRELLIDAVVVVITQRNC